MQLVFHVYLNKFKIAATHLFFISFVKIDLHRVVWSPGIRSHQSNSSLNFIRWFETVSEDEKRSQNLSV